ncbi:MAG: monoamine oxidase [Maribacter sp.]|jgi:monoamine oxidase
MKTIKSDITIIGGGLTGLALAYFLRNNNLIVNVVEARERLGGRIKTRHQIEMGATWLATQHTSLIALLKELNIDIFEQELGERAIFEPASTSPPQLVHLPHNSDPSYRVKGGTSKLIHTLANGINDEQIYFSQSIKSIQQEENGISLFSEMHHFETKKVISTLPPYLLIKTIQFNPTLPQKLIEIAQNTHTWMGESIKIGLTYEQPFWKEKNKSGTIFSNVGPIPEMYDHSNYEKSHFALKGFFNGSYFSVSKEERLELVMKQLQKYYGEIAKDFVKYEETVWRNEPFTFAPYDAHVLPHQNNGHSIYQNDYWNNSLFIAGAETANYCPGYMEGAIRSARFIADKL